jgi:hypothetical protein
METGKITQDTYPYETIDLPSGGKFYPETSPLRSGRIDIYFMTAKHEDILTSTNLIKKGVVLDRVIDSLIATKGVRSNDLLVGDLNAVMVAARILGYGKDYPITIECPKCGSEVEQTVDLSTLEPLNDVDALSGEDVTITLPLSKAEVVLRFLTRGDEIEIEKEVTSLKKINSGISGEVTARLRGMIKSVNGDTSKATIWKFVENMLVKDSKYLRDQYALHIPDINFNIEVECECEYSNKKARLPIGTDFFWPNTSI